MNEFLRQSRCAFRALHGLEKENSPAVVFDATWFDAARRNRVVGLWADVLPAGEPWHRYACGQILHSARLSTEAGRIAGALKNSVEDLRMVKGPALAVQAWPRPELRTFDDLDFRCARNSFVALIAGLRILGYQPVVEDACRLKNLWHFGWGIEFRHADGFMIEFNHRMFPPHYLWPENLTWKTPDGWAPLEVDQHPVECPAPALHLLLACVHAAWHGWERLGWLADIAGLLVRHPGVLASAERLAAHHAFARQALRCGCGIAQQIFGPLPGASEQGAIPDVWMDQALAVLLRTNSDVPFYLQRQIHHQLMSPLESVRYTVRRLATPGDSDFKQWSLNPRLCFLYWVLRPLRYFHQRQPLQGITP